MIRQILEEEWKVEGKTRKYNKKEEKAIFDSSDGLNFGYLYGHSIYFGLICCHLVNFYQN